LLGLPDDEVLKFSERLENREFPALKKLILGRHGNYPLKSFDDSAHILEILKLYAPQPIIYQEKFQDISIVYYNLTTIMITFFNTFNGLDVDPTDYFLPTVTRCIIQNTSHFARAKAPHIASILSFLSTISPNTTCLTFNTITFSEEDYDLNYFPDLQQLIFRKCTSLKYVSLMFPLSKVTTLIVTQSLSDPQMESKLITQMQSKLPKLEVIYFAKNDFFGANYPRFQEKTNTKESAATQVLSSVMHIVDYIKLNYGLGSSQPFEILHFYYDELKELFKEDFKLVNIDVLHNSA